MRRKYRHVRGRRHGRVPVIALVGVPNTGKSTVFNLLTGMDQEIGNFPGVTVERKEGRRRYKGSELRFIDLPGCQSLSGRSADEMVTRDLLLAERPDLIVQIADSTSLERSFFLLSELLDLGTGIVLVLNMMDSSRRRGDRMDLVGLQRELDLPVVPMSGRTGEGLEDLLDSVHRQLKRGHRTKVRTHLEEGLERKIGTLQAVIGRSPLERPSWRWEAIALLKGDEKAVSIKGGLKASQAVVETFGATDPAQVELSVADSRYRWSRGLIDGHLVRGGRKDVLTQALDGILANRLIGIPAFLVVLWGVFRLTFSAAEPLMAVIDAFFSFLSASADRLLGSSYMAGLVSKGVLGGVGAVMVFAPSIFILFFSISLLEESGYMARAAFLMDRVMHKVGLPGRSFIPLVLGFGCNVPAVMAARTIEDKNDRIVTVLVSPFIPCSARLPVFILLSGVFFGAQAGLMIILLYAVGVAAALVSAFVLRKLFLHGRPAPFLMELPPYRPPPVKQALFYAWRRAWMYMKKAGTVILIGAVLIWVLSTLTPCLHVTDDPSGSMLGEAGKAMEPVFEPIGSDWRLAVSLSFGVFAKEMVVGGLGVLFDEGEGTSLSDRLREDPHLDPLKAFSFMVFVLLYMPCLATFSAIRNETGSWKWAFISLAYGLIVAYMSSLAVYQGGALLGF